MKNNLEMVPQVSQPGGIIQCTVINEIACVEYAK